MSCYGTVIPGEKNKILFAISLLVTHEVTRTFLQFSKNIGSNKFFTSVDFDMKNCNTLKSKAYIFPGL